MANDIEISTIMWVHMVQEGLWFCFLPHNLLFLPHNLLLIL